MLDDIKVFIHSLDIWVTKTFIKGLSVLKSCLSPNVYFASAHLSSTTETKFATLSVYRFTCDCEHLILNITMLQFPEQGRFNLLQEEHALKVISAKYTYLNLGRLLHYMIPNK